jgi:FlaA1/EpsC-like NDP-sugar epimerase
MPLAKLALPLLALPRPAKRVVALALDASLIVLTVWIAFYLRLDEWVRLAGEGLFQPMWAVTVSWLIALPVFITHGFYRAIFRYSGMAAMQMVLRALALYALLYAAVVTAIGLPGVPRSVGIIQPMLLLLAVGASRALARYWLGGLYQNIFQRMNLPKAVIYGAGGAGRQLAQALAHSHEIQVVAFLDDDDRLHGHVLNGLPIHSSGDLQGLVETQGVRTVLLAIPSLPRQQRNEILADLRHFIHPATKY